MTPSQTKKLRKFVGAWVLRQRKKMGLSMEAFGDLIGRSGWQVHSYETGKSDVPFSALLAISYEADCTVEETQELFEAYAAIKAPGPEGKICIKCGEVKKEEDFPKKGGGRPGRQTVCKSCRNANLVEWRRKKKQGASEAGKPVEAPPEKKRHFPPFKGYAA